MGASPSKLIQQHCHTDEWCNIFKIVSWHDGPLSTSTDTDATEDSALCTRCLSRLACLTLVCSDRLRSCSPWRRYCSLAVLLSSRSRHNLSLALSRFIGVELHSEESSVEFSRFMGVELDSEGSIVSTCTEHEFCQIWNVMGTFWYPFVYFKFSVYGHTYVSRHTYTHVLQCSPASVGLAQACPN